MNYNTETINQMAQQLAEMFKSAVIAQQASEGSTPTIAQIETDMREALRQVGNQALGLFLSSMQMPPEKEMPCSCGGTLHYQRMREALVISVFGRTLYVRAYYAGCDCKQGKAPLDEQFGLEAGAVTAGWPPCWRWPGLSSRTLKVRSGYKPIYCLIFPKTQCARRQSGWEHCKKNKKRK